MNPRLIQILAIVAAAGLVFASSRFAPRINAGRAKLNMLGTEAVEQSAPPEYAFAIQAFGAFRGILTNIAFIRAEQYKEQGRYYDAMQLASWICALQPRFPSVWEFHSWNMAWNISVTTYTPEERWNWVYNGVKLLRDEGLKYNPRAINLYKQLAWIFVNKMSETTDQYHLFYKRNWAWRMHLVLGSPPDPLGHYRPEGSFEVVQIEIGQDRLAQATRKEAERRVEQLRKMVETRGAVWDIQTYEAAVQYLEQLKAAEQQSSDQSRQRLTPSAVARQAAYERMKTIADAPDRLAELYAAHPDAQRMVAELRTIGVVITDEELSEDAYMRAGVGLADTFFYRYRLLTEPPALLAELQRDPAPDPDAPNRQRMAEILRLGQPSPAREALVAFLQKKVLREVYELKAGAMAELTARFGPIDWRVVDAHALYWVNEGLIATDDNIRDIKNDKTNTARMIFFALRNLMQRNRVVFEPYTKDINYAYINFSPDLNFIEPMHEAFLTYGASLDPEPEASGVGATYRTGHINFLAEAIRMLYFADREVEAQQYYDYLRDTYAKELPTGELEELYQLSLRDYVFRTLAETGRTLNEMRTQVYAFLMQGWHELAQGNRFRANELRQLAAEIHHRYNEEEVGEEEVTKLAMPPLDAIQADTLMVWYRQPAVSPFRVVLKARLWSQLSPELQLPVYDRLIEQLRQECELFELDVTEAFPPPPGLEAWRETHTGRAEERPDTGVETPAQND